MEFKILNLEVSVYKTKQTFGNQCNLIESPDK